MPNDIKAHLQSLSRPVNIVVTGGRNYCDINRIRWALGGMNSAYGIARLAHGAARGADVLSAQVASLELHVPEVVAYPVDTTIDGPWPAAGCKRNARMLKVEYALGPLDLVVAFPGGRGTAHCVRTAKEMGVKIWEVPS